MRIESTIEQEGIRPALAVEVSAGAFEHDPEHRLSQPLEANILTQAQKEVLRKIPFWSLALETHSGVLRRLHQPLGSPAYKFFLEINAKSPAERSEFYRSAIKRLGERNATSNADSKPPEDN
jgi:hypothetical protein